MPRIDVYFHATSNDSSQDKENLGSGEESKAVTPIKSQKNLNKQVLNTIAINTARQSVNYGISVFGDLTGNYQGQRDIQGYVDGVGLAINMANFPVGTVATSLEIGTRAITSIIKNKLANQNAELLRQRAGNETVNNSEEV